MTHRILTDFSPAVLAHAAKTNLHEFLRYTSRADPAAALDDAELARWCTHVPFAWFNGVFAARSVAGGDEDLVRDVIAWFKDRDVTDFSWWLASTLPRDGWEPLLRDHGFQLADGPPGMAADLHALKVNGKAPPSFDIVPVADVETLATWTHTFVTGYGLPPAWEPVVLEMMTVLGLDLPVRSYLGYLDGEPVAASTLYLGAGVAGILNVATLAAARGQGLGTAMTLAPLREAREMGYRIGILQSSEMGFPVYRRLGFEQVCNVEHFYWAGANGAA